MEIIYPFTAIVGQEKAKLALLCNAVNPAIGGVLLSGDKGTGKSTMVRALADVLPEIEVVKGCPFNCNPRNELEMCDACRSKDELEIEKRKMKVVNLPLSVTVDRLVGTIDVEKVLKEGIRALQPGILAEANRNILYIDEVNLLDDYIADILLDVAAMGWNIIEREGISLKHPSRFILVGSMNPEEGELRPQILDRFGLYVQVEAIKDVEQRIEIIRRVEEFREDPISFRKKFEKEQKKLRERIERARELVNKVEINDDLLTLLIKTIIDYKIKTHRAEIVTVRTAKAIAALDGRKKVCLEDLKKAMELALPHRMKDKPFEVPKDLKNQNSVKELEDKNNKNKSNKSINNNSKNNNNTSKNVNINNVIGAGNSINTGDKGKYWGSDKFLSFDSTDIGDIVLPKGELDYIEKVFRGSRDEKALIIGQARGYPISYIPSSYVKLKEDIDIIATIKSAILKGKKVCDEDLMIRVRKVRVPRLAVIVLDVSGSMIAKRRISIAKGIAEKIIENSYIKRDFLALITFGGYSARVLVPPTKRYRAILDVLKSVGVGGKTPLTSALQSLLMVAKSFRLKNRNAVVRAILITDGKANVTLYSKSIKEDIKIIASALRKNNIKIDIFDTSSDFTITYIPYLATLLDANIHKI
ncbi:MAG TPA: VWA domain-containing protein [Archaeoglobus profundus]|nr:VWA domain-containing protein [Archaeoglobus profundus]HIP58441.1 VWA domain-containing protein [Archaeoglobus profundus]